ncbi:U3 small nucleolar RNA-associated protein 12 [Pancytospora philotis]|nr:U3 small nucleolar RNA-associated protein 12 [Pancytospora philotis]
METDGCFIPNFTQKAVASAVVAKNSRVCLAEGAAYVSVNSKLNRWDLGAMEVTAVYGSVNQLITAFAVLDRLVVIGYKNGLIEIVSPGETSRVIRLHGRSVLCIAACADGFVSSSADGSVCIYDTVLEQTRISLVGSPVAVERVVVSGTRVLAVCADKSLRIWSMDSAHLEDVRVFEDYVFGVAARGQQALVVLRSGRSFLVELADAVREEGRERQPFENFAKIRGMAQHGSRLVVHMQKKLIVYAITKESSLGLLAEVRADANDAATGFDFEGDRIVFLSKQNNLLTALIPEIVSSKVAFDQKGAKMSAIAHATDILDIRVCNDLVYTLSKERLIVWKKVVEDRYEGVAKHLRTDVSDAHCEHFLEPVRWIALERANCLCLVGEHAVVGGDRGVSVVLDGEIIRELETPKVVSVCAFNDVFAVCIDTAVYFYDLGFSLLHELSLPEPAIYASFSPCGQLFCVSTLDNKINVFNFPALDLKLSLYGHSLPVRSFAISPDSKTLASCGADKLVKLWGLEFGECKKNIIGNALNVDFVREIEGVGSAEKPLFAFADRAVKYFDGPKKLREYKAFSPGLVAFGSSFLVATSEKGVLLFTMDRYAYAPGEESEEEEPHPMENAVASTTLYDQFLDHLEHYELDASAQAADAFYAFLLQLDLTELASFLYVLTESSVHTLLRLLEASLGKNAIVNCRILLMLINGHLHICRGYGNFAALRAELLGRMRPLRELSGENEFRLLVGTERDGAELDKRT